MDYKLFSEYITLQALLKELGIIHSGGAIKTFLSENQVFFNDQLENRRGKKIRIGDVLTIPSEDIKVRIVSPNPQEKTEHQKELDEKKRVSELVKSMNKENKKQTKKQKTTRTNKKAPVRFPGI